jgi:hypothetical protein
MKTIFKSLLTTLAISAFLISCSDASTSDSNWQRVTLDGTNMSLELPPDMKIRSKRGEDFMLYFITQKDSAAPKTWSGGIYMGSHPAPFEPGNDSVVKMKVPLEILGAAETLTVFTHRQSTFGQTVFSLKADNVSMHMFGTAWQSTYIDTLKRMISTVRKNEN